MGSQVEREAIAAIAAIAADPRPDADALRKAWRVAALPHDPDPNLRGIMFKTLGSILDIPTRDWTSAEGWPLDTPASYARERLHRLCEQRLGWRRLADADAERLSWSPEETAARLAPIFADFERRMGADDREHFNFAWNVLHRGFFEFRGAVKGWMISLEARGLQRRGLHDEFTRALAMEVEDHHEQNWWNLAAERLPLLTGESQIVAAQAAKGLGAFYFLGYDEEEPAAPSLAEVMAMLVADGPWKQTLVAGFIHGFDGDQLRGVEEELERRGVNFDQGDWIMAAFAGGMHAEDSRDVPNVQPLWFPVHEFFCFDPDFVSRLLEEGHEFTAMMTATEMRQRVEGMAPVLRRIAREASPTIAASAASHMARHYGDELETPTGG